MKAKFKLIIFATSLIISSSLLWAQSFNDVTASAGLAMIHDSNKMSTGIAVADFDKNGWPDLFYTGYFKDSKLYFNQGNGTFLENINFTMPNMTNAQCGSVAAADYDNDGWPDLYVACLGDNYLLHNNNGLGFLNATISSGTNHPTRSEAVSWGDINNDGWLDLVIAAQPATGTPNLSDPNDLDHFFINNHDGTFADIYTSFQAVEIAKATLALMMFDVDFDNDLDIYFANDKHDGNVLFRNDGPGCNGWCFTNIANTIGANHPAFCMGVATSDYDHDGDWDVSYSSIDEHIFLQNQNSQGNNTFIESASSVGVNFTTGYGWGTVFFDADNDSWEDLFVGLTGGAGAPASNKYFHNNKDGTFTNLTSAANLIDTNPTQAVAWLDFNRDGKLDLSYSHFNIDYRLYENLSQNTNHWIVFTFEAGLGSGINRDAIGTKIFLTTANGSTQIKELKSGESRGSNNQLMLHFGVGNQPLANAIVHWPNGIIQNLGPVTSNRYIHVEYPIGLIFSSNFE